MALASETGWSEKFILEELPLARLLLYQHALLHGGGAWTVPPDESVDDQAAALGV